MLLYLHRHLALDAGHAAQGGRHVSTRGALHSIVSISDYQRLQTDLYVVLVPGLVPQQQGRDAGGDAAEEAVEDPRLVKTLGILVDQTGLTEQPTATSTCLCSNCHIP